MKKLICLILAIAMALSVCITTAFATDNDAGKPVYVTVYGLNQLNRNCISAYSSAGYVDSVQIWDGGECIKTGWLKPNHEYTIKVRVNGVNVKLDGNRGIVYLNGRLAWGSHGINLADESQSFVTAKTTFTTPRYYGFYPWWCWSCKF